MLVPVAALRRDLWQAGDHRRHRQIPDLIIAQLIDMAIEMQASGRGPRAE